MWWNIMVSALILLVFRWYILVRTEMWTRSKENCSSDAMSVYVCKWNKEFWENMIAGDFIIEWVINRATASLSLLNTSGSVAMHRYQWLSNTCAWHYILTFTALHNPRRKSTGTTRMTPLLVQQLVILAESMCKSMDLVENKLHQAS